MSTWRLAHTYLIFSYWNDCCLRVAGGFAGSFATFMLGRLNDWASIPVPCTVCRRLEKWHRDSDRPIWLTILRSKYRVLIIIWAFLVLIGMHVPVVRIVQRKVHAYTLFLQRCHGLLWGSKLQCEQEKESTRQQSRCMWKYQGKEAGREKPELMTLI
jgi:hypothetical protein